MNGALLGVIMIAIFLTGMFTGTTTETAQVDTKPEPQPEAIEPAEMSVTANTKLELYRVEGKTFDPYLLSVKNCGSNTMSLSQLFQNDNSGIQATGRSETLSLRSETPIPIYHADGETELDIEDIQTGDVLLVIRDLDSNEIRRVAVGQAEQDSSIFV